VRVGGSQVGLDDHVKHLAGRFFVFKKPIQESPGKVLGRRFRRKFPEGSLRERKFFQVQVSFEVRRFGILKIPKLGSKLACP
jgi:hypothetical protein